MIILLGSSGYYGSAFAAELRRRGHSFIPLSRTAFDYTRFDYLFDYLRTMKPVFLINAAGFACPPEEDGQEKAREQAMLANALLPQMIARVCLMTKTPWGHVSSGSIYTGAKILEDGQTRLERDLSRRGLRELFEQHPERFLGFNELDEPNYSFRYPPSSFSSGTKALAEEAIRDIGQCYLWRLRLPFNEKNAPCGSIPYFERPTPPLDAVDSFSHTEDCVRACLDLWESRAPFGIYNVTNPGALPLRRVAEGLHRAGKLARLPDFRPGPEDLSPAAVRVPECHCILDTSKLLAAGVKLRPIEEAWRDSLDKMRKSARPSPPRASAGSPGPPPPPS